MNKKVMVFILYSILVFRIGYAQKQANLDTIGLYLDFPLLDLPYQKYATTTTGNFLNGYANPSMNAGFSNVEIIFILLLTMALLN
ncbi:MAG: hypothetical protein HC892_18760 [Saprospiraceae bacterium]|nr:hypothetical protein [Saprospiraceae bacterium]